MLLRIALGLYAIALCAWEPGLGAAFPVLGARPHLDLVIITSIGLLLGQEDGAVAGFLCGMLEVAHTAGPGGGAFVASRVLVGYAAGSASHSLFARSLLVPVSCTAVATVGAEVVRFILAPYPDLSTWARLVLVQSIYNGALAVAIHPVAAWLSRRLPSRPRAPRQAINRPRAI
ncbi:MAG TPA: hypothetical protein PLQ54_12340 [Armatimonadota bacterium]|nr:hypothetical protein [Armatimonadota bacterium]